MYSNIKAFTEWLKGYFASNNYRPIFGNTDSQLKSPSQTINTFSNTNMLLLTRITFVALVATLVLLACSWTSVTAGSIHRTAQKDPSLQEKLDILRQMSKEAGLPQVELADEDVCLDPGCLEAGKFRVPCLQILSKPH